MNLNIDLIPLHYNGRKEIIFEKVCFLLEKKGFEFFEYFSQYRGCYSLELIEKGKQVIFL